MNVGCGPAEERVLLTALHTVADIYYDSCKTALNWKYVCDFLSVHKKTLYMYLNRSTHSNRIGNIRKANSAIRSDLQ